MIGNVVNVEFDQKTGLLDFQDKYGDTLIDKNGKKLFKNYANGNGLFSNLAGFMAVEKTEKVIVLDEYISTGKWGFVSEYGAEFPCVFSEDEIKEIFNSIYNDKIYNQKINSSTAEAISNMLLFRDKILTLGDGDAIFNDSIKATEITSVLEQLKNKKLKHKVYPLDGNLSLKQIANNCYAFCDRNEKFLIPMFFEQKDTMNIIKSFSKRPKGLKATEVFAEGIAAVMFAKQRIIFGDGANDKKTEIQPGD